MGRELGYLRFDVGGAQIFVHEVRPVAVVRRADEADQVLSWPDLDAGFAQPTLLTFVVPDGVWVVYRFASNDRFTPMFIVATGDVKRCEPMTGYLYGCTSHGLWIGDQPTPKRDESAFDMPVSLTILAPDGSLQPVEINRIHPAPMSLEGADLLLAASGPPVAPTPPAMPPGAPGVMFGSTHGRAMSRVASWGQRPARSPQVLISLPANLPRQIVVEEMETVEFDDADMIRRMSAMLPAKTTLDGIAESQWELVSLPDDDIATANKRALQEFADPNWRVSLRGEWPTTQVVVLVPHGDLILRRTLDLFDGAGRVNNLEYASVHLFEDLHGTIDTAGAVDGFVDI